MSLGSKLVSASVSTATAGVLVLFGSLSGMVGKRSRLISSPRFSNLPYFVQFLMIYYTRYTVVCRHCPIHAGLADLTALQIANGFSQCLQTAFIEWVNLGVGVSLAHAFHLPFSNHIHRLVASR